MNQKNCYLIVGTGRSGSSLLAAILSQCDADFGLDKKTTWDRVKGAFEHPDLHNAYAAMSKAKKISESLIPDKFGRKYFDSKCDVALERVMSKAIFAKSSKLIWLVQRIYKLGYKPNIIIQYRRFDDYAASRYLKFGWSVSQLVEEYCSVHETAILQQALFGGCVVSYEDIVNLEEINWAVSISTLTGISQDRLLNKREELVSSTNNTRKTIFSDNRIIAITEKLDKLKN